MIFTDPIFFFYFLPSFLIVARVLSSRPNLQLLLRIFIIAATLIFYGFQNPLWIALFAATILPAYLFTLLTAKTLESKTSTIFLTLGIAHCLTMLMAFKYLNWFSELWPPLSGIRSGLATYFGEKGWIELPPGISFYVFEAISCMVDVFRRKIDFPRRFLDYANFICFFPRFIAGPIIRYSDVSEQLRQWPPMNLNAGLTLFSLGFSLKILFADQFAKFTRYAFEVSQPDFLQALTGSVAYTFQIYFDFWGYSIMAMGLGYCLGFRFPDNFRMPYRSVSITDFWRRWHITLSSWLRDYLYISLGGNRLGKLRQYVNLLITMALGGLWHGASSVFVLWGVWHGVLLVFERIVGIDRLSEKSPPFTRLYAFMLVFIGWILFRSTSLSQAFGILAGLFGTRGFMSSYNPLLIQSYLFSATLCVVGLVFFAFFEPGLFRDGGMLERRFAVGEKLFIYSSFILALIVRFSEEGVPFLYFQF
jgi:alginate O-acetyltransferase complex protein AlgI